MHRNSLLSAIALGLLTLSWLATAESGEPEPAGPAVATAEQLKFFESKVRPLLVENCHKCHGPDKQKGSLRLDAISTILEGGDSGPAVVPGKPDESLLIEAVRYESYEMPPSGQMKDEQIAILEQWVRLGAPWPEEAAPVRVAKEPKITEEDRSWWAYQPVQPYNVPEVNDRGWSRNEIDQFVFRRLAENNLTPAKEADRIALLRRACFDLHGLPPTPQETEAFLADTAPGAYDRLIDRLLESPRYGERWARHWLDVVRYAESDGYREDAYRPHAWRYRDYVIQSLNEDKPYDQFIRQQLAGDEITPTDP
jgi:mono/diheme cytochrome c family protein